MMANSSDKILLTYLNGTGYVFVPDDYMALRREHRIVGNLVGTASTRGMSPNERTLPMELCQHELQLLLEKDIAVLVSKKESLLRPPTADELQTYKMQQEARIMEQKSIMLNEKLKEVERNMDKVLEGKRRKLIAEGVRPEDIKLDASEILREVAENFQFNPKQAFIQLPCAYLEPHTARVVQPSFSGESLKYRVFRHFWELGFYVTPGDAFGGDFLVYPSDPLICHAAHIVIILDRPNELLGNQLVGKVRLAVTVNKFCVFAYYARNPEGSRSERNEDIQYMTFQWEGPTE